MFGVRVQGFGILTPENGETKEKRKRKWKIKQKLGPCRIQGFSKLRFCGVPLLGTKDHNMMGSILGSRY